MKIGTLVFMETRKLAILDHFLQSRETLKVHIFVIFRVTEVFEVSVRSADEVLQLSQKDLGPI